MSEEINDNSHLDTGNPSELLSNLDIEEMLKELIDYHESALSNPKEFLQDIDSNLARMNSLVKSITSFIVQNPSHFFLAKSERDLEVKKEFLERLWSNLDYEEVFNELFWGTTSNEGVLNEGYLEILGSNYASRLKKLKPTFYIYTTRIEKNTKLYYGEAINSWLLGSFNSTVIICTSILEDILRRRVAHLDADKTQKLYPDYKKSNPIYGLKEILEYAHELNIISQKDYRKIKNIQQLRNDMVHNLHVVTGDESYEMLISTKDIIESILTE